MKKQKVFELARKHSRQWPYLVELQLGWLTELVKDVEKQTRISCAELCERFASREMSASECAAAIRDKR
jgi:hypothetical protein